MERIDEYCHIDPEGKPDNTEVEDKSWPSEGKIVFENVFARYRPFVSFRFFFFETVCLLCCVVIVNYPWY